MPVAPLHTTTARSIIFALALLWDPAHGAETPRARAVEDPYGGSGSAVLEPVRPARLPQSRRLVFSCITPGLVTFSDRPCGPAQQLYEIRLLPPRTTQPGESSSLTKSKATASPRAARDEPRAAAEAAAAVAAKAAEHKRTCQKLEEAVQTLDRRMRAGYSSSEAPRLWDRWRDAKENLRQADC